MPELTIPVRLLVEQVEFAVAFTERMARRAAQECRENKVRWMSADDEMWSRQREVDTVSSVVDMALSVGGGDLIPVRDALRETCEAAKARLQALRDELRTQCLFNGPFAPKREAA